MIAWIRIAVIAGLGCLVLWAEDSERWAKEMARFKEENARLSRDNATLTFVGSSSLRLWDTLTLDFPSVRLINRGFGGSQLHDILHNFEILLPAGLPSGIVIYEGDNDLQSGKEAERFLSELETLKALLDEAHPGVPVAFLAIKPSPSRQSLLAKQQEVNRQAANRIQHWENWSFVDVATPLLQADGQPDPLYFQSDRLHLNANGYNLWREILRPWVQSLPGTTAGRG